MSVPPVIEVVAAVVVGPDDRTLLVRKRGTSAFMNPGGKPEPGESHRQALVRELHEEIGLTVDPAELEPLGTIETDAANEPGHLLVAHVFTLRVASADHRVAAEIEESRWVDPADPGDLRLAPLAAEHLLPGLVRGRR
ncbi:NUDIX domain-containing protein [Aeromicrobium sp. Leaf350]|uniref:NUDIX hydrolase n=1 Tax=Aeromicrobium sp. Leaf350 TaxID=2876565 RepID=UPI001E48A3C6|nr:NUDIX domain-containing protein [Aeromicrobium sp. Leaf350]